ncbi:universal stress protein [Gammaproteobacteria bacterium]|nr:universal stress protein [Gammaproteobacteria bacterium]
MYKSILLPIDLGHKSSWEKAIPVAVALAKQHGAKIHVLTIIPDYGNSVVASYFPKDFEEKARSSSEVELNKLVAEHIPGDVLAEAHVGRGSIYKEIMTAADSQGCDLIVLASHRPEMSDYLLGPNAARVVRHASQSVFVVR